MNWKNKKILSKKALRRVMVRVDIIIKRERNLRSEKI